MFPPMRHMVYLAMFAGIVCSAPLDEEKIYFPGENPYEASNPGRDLPQSDQRAMKESSQHNMADVISPHLDAEHFYGSSSTYEGGYRQLPRMQGLNLPEPYSRPAESQDASSETSQESSNQQPSVTHGASSYIPRGFLYQGEENTGMLLSDQQLQKQLWAKSHMSTSGASQFGQGSNQVLHPEETVNHFGMGLTSEHHQNSVTSSAHHTKRKELTSILERPTHYQIHPNIKQALGHVIQDIRENSAQSLQPSHHSVRKTSLMKKAMVQNVGREPSYIQSTSSNDDISLSHLIEQLQMLEQSPKHVNITWCEEKIKEFLQALRRKQASGVFINQEVQEQTLHQVLTHEAAASAVHREEIHEPLIQRVTFRPLGVETFSNSHQLSEVSGVMTQEQGRQAKVMEGSMSEHANTSQEEFLDNSQPEILTVIPSHELNSNPEIMSQQELTRDRPMPPFTSDTSDDLKDLELELPEYVPFKHAHSGEQTVENSHASTDKLSLQPQHINIGTPETFTGHNKKLNFPAKVPGEIEQFPLLVHHTEQHKQETTPGSFVASVETLNPSVQGNELERVNRTTGTHYQNPGEAVQLTSQQEKPAFNVIHPIEAPQDDGKATSHGSDSYVPRRPQATQEEIVSDITGEQKIATNESLQEHYVHSTGSHLVSVQTLHKQQINYDTLIEELIQLESIPGHQAIDKCEEKIQEFLEILKYQQEQGFGQNQQELEKLHQTLIDQAQERGMQLANADDSETATLPPTSFWKKVQRKIKKTYESAKDRAKEVLGK